MTEELFCQPMVEIGHRHPLAAGVPSAPRTKGMDMRMKSCRFPKCLYDGNHSWTKTLFFEGGGGHKLCYRLVGTSGELAEKLAVVEEVDSEHFWDRKNPHGVRHFFEHFVIQESSEGSSSFGIT